MNIPIKRVIPLSHIDYKRILRYDKCVKIARKDISKKGLWLLVFVVIIALLIYLEKYVWILVPGVLGGGYLYTLVKLWRTDIKIPFTQGTLRPAIIAETSPVTLVAFAGESRCSTLTKWGFQCFTPGDLPGHTLKKGEYIPCATIYERGFNYNDMYISLLPHPLAWVIPDKEIINQAIAAIDDKEWKMLEKMAACVLAQQKPYGKPTNEKIIFYYSDFLIDSTIDLSPEDNYPEELLPGIVWSFDQPKEYFFPRFLEKLKEQNKKSYSLQEFRKTILCSAEVAIHYDYTCWHEETGEEKDMEDIIVLKADSASGFTAGELLYKIHNHVAEELGIGENRFLTEISLCKRKMASGTPLYFLNQEYRYSSYFYK